MNAIPIEENMHRSNGSLALELNQKICIPSLSQLLKKKNCWTDETRYFWAVS